MTNDPAMRIKLAAVQLSETLLNLKMSNDPEVARRVTGIADAAYRHFEEKVKPMNLPSETILEIEFVIAQTVDRGSILLRHFRQELEAWDGDLDDVDPFNDFRS